MDKGTFSWNQATDRYMDEIIEELGRYGIGARKHPDNLSVWLPGGEEIIFIRMKAYDLGKSCRASCIRKRKSSSVKRSWTFRS
jgi:hypothetical protein